MTTNSSDNQRPFLFSDLNAATKLFPTVKPLFTIESKMDSKDSEHPNPKSRNDKNKIEWPKKNIALQKNPLGSLELSPWRDFDWTKEHKEALIKSISLYKPRCKSVSEARVLLLGPVGAGKSSFISSVQSVFSGRIINRAMVGTCSTSFSKKLQSFNIWDCGETGDQLSALVLCDMMGLGEEEMTGLTLHDTLAVIKGHVPEGHKFCPAEPVRSETVGYLKRPSVRERVHCVVFVVDAAKVDSYSRGMSTTFQQLREHISDLGVHQVAILTHVDQVCQETATDISTVYKNNSVHQKMKKAGLLLGMPLSSIFPVKNYCSELKPNDQCDTLLLSAVDHILQYVELYFRENPEPNDLA